MIEMTIFGGRVATNDKIKMKYYPESTNAKGAKVSNRLTVPILVNEKNQETPFNMIVTVWGKLADTCAKSLSPGREVHMKLTPKQYSSTYKQAGQNVLVNNKPLTITNVSYKVDEIKFGAESASHIASEVSGGLRGTDWFKPGHVDNTTLNARRKEINNLVYVPGRPSFGYAIVVGAQTPVTPVTPAPVTQTPVTPVTPVTPAPVAPGNFSQEMLLAALAHLQSQGVTPATTAPPAPVNTVQAQVVETTGDEMPF